MNILILSEMFQKGGAGNATRNIFKFLKKNLTDQYKINLLIPYNVKKLEGVYSYYNSFSILIYIFIKLFNRLISVFLTLNKFYFFQKFLNTSLFKVNKISKKIDQMKPDIVIILWYEYILNYQEILRIKEKFNAKIILIPFDMYNFTGGCRYSQACKNYKNSC